VTFKALRILAVTTMLAGTAGVALAQSADNDPNGKAPGMKSSAPSVDTGAVAPSRMPLTEPATPGGAEATGSLGGAANPPGNPAGSIDAGPHSAINAGASGRNPCYPGQSGQAVGSTNPSGMASQCK
jgi:hypothetical protein